MTRRGLAPLVALALTLGLGLAACGGGGGGSVASFCSLIKTDQTKFANSGTPAQAAAALNSVEGKAPSAIKSDMKTITDFAKTESSSKLPNAADLTKIETAVTNVEKYVKDKCGVDLSKT